MPYLVHYKDAAVEDEEVDAEEMAREGSWLVFRRTEIVIGRPRVVVVLRVASEAVDGVEEQGV